EDDFFDGRRGHERSRPFGAQHVGRHGPELFIIRKEKVLGESLAEGAQHPALEGFRLPRRRGGGFQTRLDKSPHALSDDLYRQPVGVGLKRVSRIAAVRINPSAALMEGQIILQKPLDQLERVRVSKVKKVAGMVEYKSILENGARQPAWFVRTLQERVIRSQMIGAG